MNNSNQIFTDDDVISVYTSDQAAEDGILFDLLAGVGQRCQQLGGCAGVVGIDSPRRVFRSAIGDDGDAWWRGDAHIKENGTAPWRMGALHFDGGVAFGSE